jgi:serpin B
MRSVLRHTLPLDKVDAANKALHDQINGNLNDGVKNLSANALMLTGASVRKQYEALLRSQYGAEIFTGAKVETVNGWVNDKTEGKIPRLIDDVDAGGAIILNAVYFKAAWESKFDAKLTKPSEFNLTAARKVDVPTMRQRRRYAFASNEGYGAIRMPYAGSSIAMVLVRPDEIEGAKDVALKLGGKELAALFAQLRNADPRDVDLALPRFRAEFGADLKAQFQAAGMIAAFDDIKANFSGIAGRGLYIEQIVHKAFVDVTEEGAEATAATAVRMRPRTTSISIDTTRRFHVDRPFLFYIVDMNSDAILFQGLIQDPSPKQS